MNRAVRYGLISIAVVAVGLSVYNGYSFHWTGFGRSVDSKGDIVPAKTLWDWLDLLVVPLFLAIAAWLLDGSRKASEARVEADRQRQKTLDDYLECMTSMLLARSLNAQETSESARGIARTRTLAALRSLDGGRKAQLLQFLYESGLIGPSPVVQLNGADLTGAEMDEAVLRNAELRGVHFEGASFRNATLTGADLRGSDFSRADFTGATMDGTNFTQAILVDAVITDSALGAAITDQATH
jgi:hypothetical protein